MPVELAPAGDRTLAADVERAERVELAGVRDADDHAVLLLHRGIGGGRLHAAEFERRALVLVEIGQDRRGLDGLGREAQRRARAHRARSPRATGAPSSRDQQRWRRRYRRARARYSAARPRRRWSRPARIAACSSSIVASSRRNGVSVAPCFSVMCLSFQPRRTVAIRLAGG